MTAATRSSKRPHLPRWLARINKRTFNVWEIRRGKRPVLSHVGRSSGQTLHTPLDAHQIDGGYLFIPMYGAESDWVLNILAAGSARLTVDGEERTLVAPRLVSGDEALPQLPPRARKQKSIVRLEHFLQMDLA